MRAHGAGPDPPLLKIHPRRLLELTSDLVGAVLWLVMGAVAWGVALGFGGPHFFRR